MSGLFRAVTPRSFPVKLGDLTFHATGWKLSCVRQYAQQNGVQGSCYVTNSGARTKQLVLDGSFFYEGMRAKDISAVMSRLHSRWDKESFASYCERFALPMEKPFKEFSKGMRAKLALTTALAHHPKLLVLDEATSGLDPVVRSEMLDLFLEFIQDEEHSILLSSHITSDLEKVADYITFIHAGKIVFSKTKDDILEQYGVVKCEKARAAALDGAHILGRRDSKFDAELLVDNRPEVARLYPGILTEQATIDDIMTFFAKGAYDA